MNTQLKDNLCEYLGQLMRDYELENDWLAKDKIARKINAANVLLGFDTRIKTFGEAVSRLVETTVDLIKNK